MTNCTAEGAPAGAGSPPPDVPEDLDGLVVAAADGDTEALARITRAFQARTPPPLSLWPRPQRETWTAGLELVLEALPRQALDTPHLDFLAALRAGGFDSAHVRDLCAAAARRTFAAYPDPAGLIRALGLLDRVCPMLQVQARWDLFAALAPGRLCFHPAHGRGTLQEVDGFSGSVTVQFAVRQLFPLELALEQLLVVRPGSVLDELLAGRRAWAPAAPAAALHDAFRADLIPAARASDETIARLLVPGVLDAAGYAAFLAGQAVLPAAGDAPAEAGGGRPWQAARTLEELADLLQGAKDPALDPEAAQALRDLFARQAARADQGAFFAVAAARLWHAFPASTTLVQILTEAAATAPPWQAAELFAEVSDKLPGRLAAPWFEATLAVRGPAWTAGAGTILPQRLIGPLARTLEQHAAEGLQPLLDAVLERIRARTASADVLAWLWHSGRPEREVLANPDLVFKTLVRPVRGSYHKAAKELRRAVFDDETFLRFLARDGDADAVRTLVSCIRHVPLLDKGEQQSLLVRIVRLFPEHRHLVEERQATRTVRALDKLTSIRSFELRRRELDDIVNVQIPANSRALAHARGYGDLRENAEFKAAKEHQRLLRSRRAELERAIHEVHAFDFATIQPQGQGVPGCRVTLEYAGGRRETYTLLGLWDGDPAQNHLSYDSPLGKLLVGAAVGAGIVTPAGEPATVADVAPLPAELVQWLHGEDLL
jgi:transcription elongation GreA/GreB family factor